jgi:hypothetical protein
VKFGLASFEEYKKAHDELLKLTGPQLDEYANRFDIKRAPYYYMHSSGIEPSEKLVVIRAIKGTFGSKNGGKDIIIPIGAFYEYSPYDGYHYFSSNDVIILPANNNVVYPNFKIHYKGNNITIPGKASIRIKLTDSRTYKLKLVNIPNVSIQTTSPIFAGEVNKPESDIQLRNKTLSHLNDIARVIFCKE